ncbi:MAG: DUF554 domain-containing protein [Candidatus Hodarchaeales archaeon]
MIGTIINCIAVVIGASIGLVIGKFYNEEMRTITMYSLGFVTLILGMSMCLLTIPSGLGAGDFLVLIFSLVFGSITGVVLQIETRLEKFGAWLQDRSKSKDSKFIEGFVVASIIFETGPLAILGAIQDGLAVESIANYLDIMSYLDNIPMLLTKSGLDGFASIAFTASMGIGVLFAIIPVLIYQGIITLFSFVIAPLIPLYVQQMMSVVGGGLMIGISLKLFDIKDVKVGNMIPTIIWVIPLALIVQYLGF